MKLLIVEDNLSRARRTAELLRLVDGDSHSIEAIVIASDLQTAISRLPGFDAVLCDGRFPLRPGSSCVVEEWDVVRAEARRRGIHFVLYSGSAEALESARGIGVRALVKPAAAEEIHSAVTSFDPAMTGRAYPASMGTAEEQGSTGTAEE